MLRLNFWFSSILFLQNPQSITSEKQHSISKSKNDPNRGQITDVINKAPNAPESNLTFLNEAGSQKNNSSHKNIPFFSLRPVEILESLGESENAVPSQLAAIRRKILKNYDRNIRPGVPDIGINVSVSLYPSYLEDIDESKGYAILVIFVEYQWFDDRLQWNSSSAEDCIFLQKIDIWVPPMRFRRPIVFQENDLDPEYPVRVCADGYIYMEHYARVIVPAFFDVHNFPFDRHSIELWFRHPTGGIQEINPHSVITTMDEIQFQLDVENIEWVLLNYSCRKEIFDSAEELKPQRYVFIICTMQIRRRSGFVCINFCAPSLAVTALCILATHSATSVAGARSTKYQTGMQALMAFGVYTVTLTHTIPKSNALSKLHIFFMWEIFLVFSACIISWVTVAVERSYKKRIPEIKIYLRYFDIVSLLLHFFLIGILALWFFKG